jgi:hypothetical protein
VFLLILFVDILLQPWLAGFGFAPDHIGSFRDLPQKIWLRASITGEPDVRSDGQNLTMNVQGVMIQNGNENLGAVFRPVYGKVLVKADRYPEYA